MPEIVQEIGAYAGLASVLGLAVLSALYFSQARDVKRLREWAGRAPERATDPSQPITAARMTPQPEARVPRPPAPQPVKSGAPPVPAAAGARPVSAAGPATAAAGGASAAAPTAAPAGGNSDAHAGAGNSVASPPQQPGAPPESPTEEETETKEVARDQGTPGKPAVPAQASGRAQPAVPAKTSGPTRPATAAANRPPARPGTAAATGSAAAGRGGVSQHTAVIAPPKPPWHERLFGSTRNLALTVAGVVVLGAGVAFLLTQTSDDEPSSATQQDGGGQAPAGAEPGGGNDGEQGEGRRARNRPAIDPSSVTVAVLNGTTVPGLAQSLGDRVTELGFNLGTVANSEDDEGQQRAESVILFAAGHEREAVVVSRQLDIAQREEIDPTTQGLAGDATVVVIAGADRQG